MIRVLQFVVLAIVVLIVSSCKSPLSEGKADDISVIRAEIDMTQDLSNQKVNQATVRLFDKDGKEIKNPAIKIKVNNIPLALSTKKELYYIESSAYVKDSIPVSSTYSFEIMLTNGKTYSLGSVAPLKEVDAKTIKVNDTGNYNDDLVINWNNLKDVNKLSIMKSVLLSNSTKTEQNYAYESLGERKISGSGNYVIPKSTYVTKASTISTLELKFIALKPGKINGELLEGSSINIHGEIEKTVDFDEDKI